MAIEKIIEGFAESLRKVQEADGEHGRINSPASVHLAQSIVALKDWAAELPDGLAPEYAQPNHHTPPHQGVAGEEEAKHG